MSRENVQCVETESRRAVRLGVGHGVSAPELQARKSGLLVPRPSSRGLGLAFGRAVDCWIGVAQQTDRRLVRLAGRLSSAQVPELLEACADALPIELDLSDLVSADAVGIDALQRLRSLGVTPVGASGYLQLKLDSPAQRPVAAPPPKAGPKATSRT
jgi:hypothetical protein